MDLTLLFAVAGLIIFMGFLSEYIFEKTSIPDVFWLILLGIILGQFYEIENTASFTEIAPFFTTFALIFILFGGALNIDITKLMKSVGEGGSMALIYFLTCIFVIGISMIAAGWGVWESLLLGAILGGISSDVIIPLAKKISIKAQTALDLTLESAISDVFSIIGTVTIINILVLKSFSIGLITQKIIYSFGIAIFLGVIFGLIWVKSQKVMDSFSKSYMTTIAAVLLLYSFVEFLESNGAIAALTFGIILGNSSKIFSILDKKKDYRMDDSERFFFSEISFFVKTFFFVYLGFLIKFDSIWLVLLGFLLTLLLYLARPFAYMLCYSKAKFESKDQAFMEVITPKGLAAAVLAQLPLRYGIAHGEEVSMVVIYVIMFSIIFSTAGVFLVEKTGFRGLGPFLDLRRLYNKDSAEEAKK